MGGSAASVTEELRSRGATEKPTRWAQAERYDGGAQVASRDGGAQAAIEPCDREQAARLGVAQAAICDGGKGEDLGQDV